MQSHQSHSLLTRPANNTLLTGLATVLFSFVVGAPPAKETGCSCSGPRVKKVYAMNKD